jgi:hypothetical protein
LASFLTGVGVCFGQGPEQPSPAPVLPADQQTGPAYDGIWFQDAGVSAIRSWANAEYLLSWIRNAPMPVPIASTVAGQASVPAAPANAGALGGAGTEVLSRDTLNAGGISGMRFTVGGWLDSENCIGGEFGGFFLPTRSATFAANSTFQNGPSLLVPFFNAGAAPPGPVALPLGGQGQATGLISAVNRTELWGMAGNGLFNVIRDEDRSLTLLLGVRYLDLLEGLEMGFTTVAPGGATLVFDDRFSTRNQFWGCNLGARGEMSFGDFFAGLCAQVALGDMHESIEVGGQTNFTAPAGGFHNSGGLFAQPSNSGRRTADVFAVVPEIGVQFGYNVTSRVRVFCSYDFLYASDVVRPGDQIDGRINPSQAFGRPLVGPAFPAPEFNHTGFWAQGVSFGVVLGF